MKTKIKIFQRIAVFAAFILSALISKAQCTLDVQLPSAMYVCDSCPWTLTPVVTGGNAPYTYQWSDGSTTFTLQTCVPSTFTVTVTDAMGCTDTASVHIVQVPPLNISVEIHNPSCPTACDGWIIIHGASWLPGVLYDVNGMTLPDSIFQNLCIGTYMASIMPTSYYSCTDNETFTLESTSCFCDSSNGECAIVCERNVTNYSAPLHAGSSYQWVVNGAQTYSANNNNITVTWDDDSINNGFGTIKYVETLANGTLDSLVICYRISDAPVASFTTAPPPVNGIVDICSGTNISFINHTTGASSYFWDFGNGITSTLSDPDYTFNQTGIFVVHLTANGDCQCSSGDSIIVHVTHSPGPDVECASVVCANDTATYSTSVACSIYNWSVTGGSILSPQTYGSAIVVAWGNGSSGNGSVTLDVGNCTGLCATPTTISIPIVSGSAAVSGDDVVCTGDIKTYTVANIPGTTFTWNLSGGGTIVSGQGTNSILVNWNNYGTYTLSVNYNFDLLGCSGNGTMQIKVSPDLYVYTGQNFCLQDGSAQVNGLIQGYSGNYLWIVKDPSGSSSSSVSASPLTVNFTTAGAYSVTGTPDPHVAGLSCNDSATVVFNVFDVEKPTGITGEGLICPGSTYEYSSSGLTSGIEFYWIITGGVLSSIFGDEVSVTWNSTGPYSLSVKQKRLALPNCESDTISIAITPYAIQGITGSQSVCANGQDNYSIQGITKPEVYYEWSVTPTLGSVISGQGTPAIGIEWLNATGIAAITVTAINCNNQAATLNNIVVHLPTAPTITPAAPSFCEGSSVMLTSSPAATYSWMDSTGSVIGASQNVTITYGGYFMLTATDANGCTADTTVFVNENPAPDANISTPDANLFCIPTPVSATLYALTAAGYSYVWYLNGNIAPGSTNSPTYVVTQAGSYNVVVTNSFNCTATSGSIPFSQVNCPPPNCFVNDFVDFTFSNCDPLQFTGSVSSGNVTGPAWNFGDPLSGNNTATGMTAVHDFSSAGYYHVVFSANAPNLSPPPPTCPIAEEHVVAVYANADFKYVEGCSGTATQFTDLSTWLPGYPVTSWQWSFGDMSANSNLQNPSHIYAVGGMYNVTLTITSSVCTITISKQIVIPGITANASYLPSPVCSGTAVNFSDLSIHQSVIESWLWNFGDGTSSANQNPAKTYTSSGNKTVTLTVTDMKGCTDSYSLNINVNPLPSPGVITPPGPISLCGNGTVSLSAPAGVSWNWTSGETTQNVSAESAGNYSVEVTTSNNCVYLTPPVVINIIPKPRAEIIAGDHSVCAGGTIYLTAYTQANQTYQWFETGNASVLSSTSTLFTGTPLPGTHQYYLVVTSIQNSCTDTSDIFTVLVTAVAIPPWIYTTPLGNNCGGDEVTISVANPHNNFTYYWSNGVTMYYNGGTVPSITTNLAGTYTVTATDSSGCSSTSQQAVINAAPDFSSVLTGCYEFCDTATVFLHAPQGYASYLWLQMVNGNWTVASNFISFPLTTSGVYALVLTTFQGCSDTSEVLTVNQFHCCNLIANVQGSILNCYGQNNGTATVVSPTGAGITYLWSTGQTTQTITGLPNGTVWVTVSNGTNCQTLASVNITSPSQMPIPVITNDADTMYSSVTDSAFTYQWYNYGALIPGADGTFYINADSGCYTLLITDVNGCTAVSDTVCLTTGIEDQAANIKENEISVYPNPFHNSIAIITNDHLLKEFILIDLTGRIVMEKPFARELYINTGYLSRSIYFYRIKSKGEILKTGKLVKQ
jgi:PKD repeat protein